MLSKCANPLCSTPLTYLREGKIFMIESSGSSRPVATGPMAVQSATPNRVEHFWLCGPCSAELTLSVDAKLGVQVVPRPLRTARAAS